MIMSGKKYTISGRDAILAYCRVHTGEPLTLRDVAHALGRPNNRQFTHDLAAARHRALDEGEEITNAEYDRRFKSYVFYHLYSDAEKGKSVGPLVRAGRETRTRVRNVGRHASWTRRNAESPEDRLYAEYIENASIKHEAEARNAEIVEHLVHRIKKEGSSK